MKILIAVPSFDVKVNVDCVKSIYDLEKPEGSTVDLEFITGYDCAKARNEIAKRALEGGYDYVLMVDSDIVLPKCALIRLLQDGKPAVFGVYPRKYVDFVEVIKYGAPWEWNVFSNEESKRDDVVEVKAVGFGCALLDVDVFRHLNYPYFKYEIYEGGSHLSEDYYFCRIAMEAGYGIFADFGVRCGHIGIFTKNV